MEKTHQSTQNTNKSIDDNTIEQELKYKLHNIRFPMIESSIRITVYLALLIHNKKLTKTTR